MRYPEKMDRPLSDDDRDWLNSNNFGHVVRQFDEEDGLLDESDEEPEEKPHRDYSRMTVKQLKAEIEDRNKEILADDPEAETIPTDGSKKELVKRLKADDESIVEEPADE